jgi:hypothetical protein
VCVRVYNSDAVNVHPFEFLCGEYNHLAALMVVGCWVTPVHVGTAVVFIVAGGFMARLALCNIHYILQAVNHCR